MNTMIKNHHTKRQVGQNPTKTKQIKLLRILMNQRKQVLHRAIKINHATAAGRKDISVLNVKRRIQERKKTGHFAKLSQTYRLRTSLQGKMMSQLEITKAFKAIVHHQSIGMDY